jgi:hypothetical protein
VLGFLGLFFFKKRHAKSVAKKVTEVSSIDFLDIDVAVQITCILLTQLIKRFNSVTTINELLLIIKQIA